jgi:penicillin V acylase-like amidase (Ntn superfamily)
MVAILGAWPTDASACTSFRLKADDGAVVYGRTAEFGGDQLTKGNIISDYSAGKQRKVCSVGQPHDMVKEIDRYRG